MAHKRRELERSSTITLVIRDAGSGWGAPHLDFPAQSNGEVPSTWREDQGAYRAFEREVVENESAVKVTQDRLALFIDAEKELACRVECDSSDVCPVGERESVRFVVEKIEDGDAVADWREQCTAIRRVDQVAFPVDGAEQVRELRMV